MRMVKDQRVASIWRRMGFNESIGSEVGVKLANI